MERTFYIRRTVFAVVVAVLASCGGGGGGTPSNLVEPELMPLVTYETGHLTLHIVNKTTGTITNVRVLYTMPDQLAVTSAMTTSCDGSSATKPMGPPGTIVPGDITLTVPAMSSGQDCVAEMDTLTYAKSLTIKVFKGDATADGGLRNRYDYSYTITRP